MKRWADYTEAERTEIVRGWTGQIQEVKWAESGTMYFLDVAEMELLPPHLMGHRGPPRKVLFMASDVWADFQAQCS